MKYGNRAKQFSDRIECMTGAALADLKDSLLAETPRSDWTVERLIIINRSRQTYNDNLNVEVARMRKICGI